MSTATLATGRRALSAWSLGPLATLPSYQNRADARPGPEGDGEGNHRSFGIKM